MSDRPIIFNAPMIQALIAGRKTQTRRVLTPQPPSLIPQVLDISTPVFDEAEGGWGQWRTDWSAPSMSMPMGEPKDEVWCPLRGVRWAVGDRLWVRESHRFSGGRYDDGEEGSPNWSEDEWFRCYGADGAWDSWDPKFPRGWSPSIHAGVHDLTGPEHDEGPDVVRFQTKLLPSIHMPRWASRLTLAVTKVRVERLQDISEADAIAEGVECDSDGWRDYLMPSTQCCGSALESFRSLWTSLHGADAWDANPWVAVITFEVHRDNIDASPHSPRRS